MYPACIQTERKGSAIQDKEFWAIIAAARTAAGEDMEKRVDALTQQLQALPPETIQAFQHKYDELIIRSDRWDLWGAAYLMNGGCSDDGFRYFRNWRRNIPENGHWHNSYKRTQEHVRCLLF